MSRLDIINSIGAKEAPSSRMAIIQGENSRPLDSRSVVKQKLAKALSAQKEANLETSVGKESGFDRFMMGGAAGVTDMINSMGNIAGLVSDEKVMSDKEFLNPYTQTTAAKFGQFGGEMVALAPLGFVGKGAQVANAALKSTSKLKFLTNPWAAATVEGAGAGAVMADPNERGKGAAIGATGGYLLNRTMALASRIGKDGIAKVNKSAEELADLVQKKTGRKPFIPLAQKAAVEGADPPTSAVKGAMDFVSMIPTARSRLVKQAKEFSDDVYETNLRQVFNGKKADEAVKVFRETGDMQRAIEAGKNAGTKKVFTATQKVLDTASRTAASSKGLYTPQRLQKSAEKAVKGDIGYAPMRDTAIKMGDVLSKPVGTSTVAQRDTFHKVQKLLAGTLLIIPKIGPILSSKSFQNFLMGNTGAQKLLKKALDTGSGKNVRQAISAIRRTMGAQPAQSGSKNEEIGAMGENMLGYVNEFTED